MKVAVLSDIHGNHVALAAVLAELRRREISEVLFLGDLVGYYPFAKECLDMLEGFRVTGVRGNHDHIAVECLENGVEASDDYRRRYGSALDRALKQGEVVACYLRALPLTRRLEIAGRRLLLCHGSPWDELEGRVYPDFADWARFESLPVDGVLLGHTHYPVMKSCGDVLVLNPGAVGQARHRSRVACAALLDVPTMTASLLEIPYDPEVLIKDAQAHDPDLPYLTQVLQR